MDGPGASASGGSAAGRWAGLRDGLLVFLGTTLLFWFYRERAHSGDWVNWVKFLERGLWYRLREPTSLAFYQVPYLAFRGLGATPEGVFAAVSCLCGGLSMVYALAMLRGLWPGRGRVALAMLALAGSFGVSGVFFGHVEHYAIMSLGCFAYLHYALRYLAGERTIVPAALAFGLLLTTHLMAAWLAPSLFLLPWLRAGPGRGREFVRGLAVAAAPNLVLWGAVLFTYYDGDPANLWNDVATGRYSKKHGGAGNALGGGDATTFLPPAKIFAREHFVGLGALFAMYSPFLVPALGVALVHRPRERFGWLVRSATGRFFLSLAVPYTLFALTWDADLGYARDWDLFSHWTLFAVLTALGLLFAAPLPRLARAAVAVGVLAAVGGTGALVHHSQRPRRPPGPEQYFEALDLEASGGRPLGPGRRRGKRR